MRKISKWKKLGIGLAAGILAFTMGTASVMAQPTSIVDEVTDAETTADHAEDTKYGILRGNHLNLGNIKVQKLSSNEVGIYGLTQCHHVCNTVYLSLYLERKVNGNYQTYKSWDFTDHNVSSLSRTIKVIVPRGSYYRVRGYHAAKDGSKEATTTLSKGVLIQ